MHRPFFSYFRWFILQCVFGVEAICVIIFSLGRWHAWKRNSLALGYWSENSDLDLTLYSDSQFAFPSGLVKLWRVFQKGGEWAAYDVSDNDWARFANPFELRRDPHLLNAFSLSKTATRTDAFVFWLRMRDSDRYLNQTDMISTRERKWMHHKNILQSEFGIQCQKTFPDFVLELGERLSPVPSSKWAELEAVLRPHRWIAEARSSGKNLTGIFADLSPHLLDIARSQIHWEIWGLLGQIRLRQNWDEVRQHLLHLAQLFPEADAIHSDLDGFLKHLERLQQRHVNENAGDVS